MNSPVATFVVLPSDVAQAVAGLARLHAAYDPRRRRVVVAGRGIEWPPCIVALVIRSDGTVCAAFTRAQALDEAWIEEGFVRAARAHHSPSSSPEDDRRRDLHRRAGVIGAGCRCA